MDLNFVVVLFLVLEVYDLYLEHLFLVSGTKSKSTKNVIFCTNWMGLQYLFLILEH